MAAGQVEEVTSWNESDIASVKELYSPAAHVQRRELLLMDGTHVYDFGVVCPGGCRHLMYYSFQTVDSAVELWAIHAIGCKIAKNQLREELGAIPTDETT
jgi:hypothetical protein